MAILYKKENQRGEERISVNLPVEISWKDSKGNNLTERTIIEDVTSVGCRFRLQVELHPGEVVSILPLGPGLNSMAGEEKMQFKVMWAAHEGIHWSTGARKV
jgi:hypothetical protein